MKDLPILFCAPMVQAILADRKLQTRRLAERWVENAYGCRWEPSLWQRVKPGDRLWVRESAWIYGRWIKDGTTRTGATRWRFHTNPARRVIYEDATTGREDELRQGAGSRGLGGDGFWLRPSIHFERWASRLTLTVTDVRVQQLKDISDADAQAEGMTFPDGMQWGNHPVDAFRNLWNDLHGPGAWDANPAVVALTFTVAKRNIDA